MSAVFSPRTWQRNDPNTSRKFARSACCDRSSIQLHVLPDGPANWMMSKLEVHPYTAVTLAILWVHTQGQLHSGVAVDSCMRLSRFGANELDLVKCLTGL